MKYDEAIEWLFSTQLFGIKLGLENVSKLIGELGIDPDSPGMKVVHVAGTNGKGSVCAFTDKILRDAGVKVGLFTSPHLISFRERIQVSGEMIPESEVAALLTEIRKKISDWDPHPTFFEICLALALQHFKNRGCETVILETGMGGRLDATNAIKAEVSVITHISVDHSQWLGETIREIAAEKAGIIKPETPVIVADLHPDARDVVGRKALTMRVPYIEAHPLPDDWPLGLAGPHQGGNAALAVEAACRVEQDRLTQEGIRESLATTTWPGRFQIIDNRYILDGAHNAAGAEALATAWKNRYGEENAALVFGVAQGKDVNSMLNSLKQIASRILFVPIKSERRMPPEEMQSMLESSDAPIPPSQCFPDIDQAWETLSKQEGKILVAGSLFLVGEALSRFSRQSFEVSEQ